MSLNAAFDHFESDEDSHDENFTKTTPTLLVLGNEGKGLRAMIANECDVLIKIDSGIPQTEEFYEDGNEEQEEDVYEVDSLNVSVTGGILMHHAIMKLNQQKQKIKYMH